MLTEHADKEEPVTESLLSLEERGGVLYGKIEEIAGRGTSLNN